MAALERILPVYVYIIECKISTDKLYCREIWKIIFFIINSKVWLHAYCICDILCKFHHITLLEKVFLVFHTVLTKYRNDVKYKLVYRRYWKHIWQMVLCVAVRMLWPFWLWLFTFILLFQIFRGWRRSCWKLPNFCRFFSNF